MFKPGIKFAVFDFDGTFTDCQFYVNSTGEHMKSYNGKDSYALKILYDMGIKTAILTAHDSKCFNHILKFNHFNKLDFFHRGATNKLTILDKWRQELKLDWSQIAYMGDDLADLACMKKVGLSACPFDAVSEIRSISIYKSPIKGGQGAVRDFVTHAINHAYFSKY